MKIDAAMMVKTEEAAAAAGLVIEHRNLDYSPRLEKEVPVKGQLAVLRLAA